MSWLVTVAAGAVIFLLGAIIAIGARPRPEDEAIERRRRQDNRDGYSDTAGAPGDDCSSDAGGDCGGGD